MSVSLSTVLNDVAEKFMKNNKKIEESNVQTNVKNEIMANNAVIGKELATLKEQIAQIGGQIQKQQQQNKMGVQMPMMIPQPMMMGQPMMMPQQPMMMPQQPQTETSKKGKEKKNNSTKKTQKNNEETPNEEESINEEATNEEESNNEEENKKEKTLQKEQMNAIDQELQERELNQLQEEQDKSLFEGPSRILGSIESAAASVLGAGDETLPATRTSGEPLQLPSLNNIENQVGEGLGQAANTMKEFTGLDKEAPNDNSTILGRMTDSVVKGVKKIGKNALGTAENAANITNNALKFTKHRKCNKEFLDDLPNIIDTCERDNYVLIFNTILQKLKGRKNNFRDVIKNQIDGMEIIDLDKEAEITPEENTLTIDIEEPSKDTQVPITNVESSLPNTKQTKLKKKTTTQTNKKPKKKTKLRTKSPTDKTITEEIPSKVDKEPIKVSKKPMKVGKEPIKVGKEPIKVGKKPIKVGKKPMKVGKKPIKVGKTVKQDKKPMGIVKKGKTKKNTSQQLATKILGKPLTTF